MLGDKGGSFLRLKIIPRPKAVAKLLITFMIFIFLFSPITASSSQEFNNYDITASVTEDDYCYLFTDAR